MDAAAEKAVALNGGDATPAPMEVWRTLRPYPCAVLNAVVLFSPLERKSGAGESTDSPAPLAVRSLLLSNSSRIASIFLLGSRERGCYALPIICNPFPVRIRCFVTCPYVPEMRVLGLGLVNQSQFVHPDESRQFGGPAKEDGITGRKGWQIAKKTLKIVGEQSSDELLILVVRDSM